MRKGAILFVLAVLLWTGQADRSAVAEDPERIKTFMAVKSLLVRGDTFQVVEYINGLGDPLIVARRYSDLVQDFYWKQKSVARVVFFGRAGIQYCLQQARATDPDAREKSEGLRRLAAAIAYNVASYTWPGWDEKGIEITKRDLEAGLDAAQLNLRLVHELAQPAIKQAYAHWILGAQLLAAGRTDKAIRSFRSAMEKGKEAEARPFIWMADGYAAIATMASGREDADAKALFDQTIAALKEMEGKEAAVFADQLITAKGVFVKATP